jgi:hypothetical protein
LRTGSGDSATRVENRITIEKRSFDMIDTTAARGAGMQEQMDEATWLTRAGRLDEATALIQRAQGGGISPGAFTAPTQKTVSLQIALPGMPTDGIFPRC